MKKILILLALLGGLIGVAVIQKTSKTKRLSVAASREKLIDSLDGSAIRKIRLKDGDKVVTLSAGDPWTVAERSGYAAATEKIQKAILDLMEQKAGRKISIGKAAWGDVKLSAPGDGDAAKAGFLVELLGEGDKPIKTLILGSNIESSKVGQAASPFGGGGNERFVRLTDDGDTVWAVGNQFYDLKAAAEEWIDKSFIDVQKIKSVEVAAPKAEDSWKASRKAEADTEFTLDGGQPKEALDNIKAGLANLLSSPTFTDVVPKDKATADFMKDAWVAKISTFEGFNYTIKALKKGDAGAEKHYITVEVTGDLPKERPAVKDEKPEDKKKADEEFATKKKALEEHLAKDKKAAGWIYEMSGYSLGSLVKKKAELLKAETTTGEVDKDGTTKVKGAATAPVSKIEAPKTPISVTTPPVSVPAPTTPLPTPPKVEVKPTPDPKANPVTGQVPPPAPAAPKPAAPAPAAATTPATPAPAPAAPPAEPAKK